MGRIICNRSLRLCSKPQMKRSFWKFMLFQWFLGFVSLKSGGFLISCRFFHKPVRWEGLRQSVSLFSIQTKTSLRFYDGISGWFRYYLLEVWKVIYFPLFNIQSDPHRRISPCTVSGRNKFQALRCFHTVRPAGLLHSLFLRFVWGHLHRLLSSGCTFPQP